MPKKRRLRRSIKRLRKEKRRGARLPKGLKKRKQKLISSSKRESLTPSKSSSLKTKGTPSPKGGQTGKGKERITGRRERARYRDSKGRFASKGAYEEYIELIASGEVDAPKITQEKYYIDPFGRELPKKKPKSLAAQIGKAGHNLCYPEERKALFKRVKADLLAAKKAQKDEFKKDRLKVYFQLTERKYGLQSFDISAFARFLLVETGSDRLDEIDFWGTNPKTGVCTKKKRIFIAMDKRNRQGRIIGAGKPIKEYKLKVNKPEKGTK